MTRRDQYELHAAAIRDVVADLNRILAAANADGLNIDLRVEKGGGDGGGTYRSEESYVGSPVIVATVSQRS